MAELRGNKAIEDAAIAWVMQLERDAGRDPVDTGTGERRPTSRARHA